MALSRSFLHSRSRNNRVGRRLLAGPEYISPPHRLDDFGWLESILHVRSIPFGFAKNAFSWSIYVDETVNRESKFLRPMVRCASWNREKENKIKRVRKWPLVSIWQHVLSSREEAKINSRLLTLDKALSSLDFAPAGLIANREEPEWSILQFPHARFLSFERHNFLQSITMTLSLYHDDNPHLSRLLQAIASEIEACVARGPVVRYREHYETNLREQNSYEGWHYKPQKSRKWSKA